MRAGAGGSAAPAQRLGLQWSLSATDPVTLDVPLVTSSVMFDGASDTIEVAGARARDDGVRATAPDLLA